MAPTAKQLKVITQKLESLEREKENLFSAVSQHVEPVMTLGKAWLQNQAATGVTFQQVREAFDKAIAYVFDAAEDVGGEAAAETRGSPACEDDETIYSLSSSLSSLATSSITTPSFVVSPSMDQVITSLQERMDKLENTGNKMSYDVQYTTSEVEQLKESVVLLEQKVGRLEENKKSLEHKLTLLERRQPEKPTKQLTSVDEIKAKFEQLTTGMIRIKKLEDRLKQNDEQRTADLKTIKDLSSSVATYTAKIDKVKKVQRPVIRCTLQSSFIQVTNDCVVFETIVSDPCDLYKEGILTAIMEGVYQFQLETEQYDYSVYPVHQNTVSQILQHPVLLQVVQVPVNPGPDEKKEWIVAGTKLKQPEKEQITHVVEVKIGMMLGDKLFIRSVGGISSLVKFMKCSFFFIE